MVYISTFVCLLGGIISYSRDNRVYSPAFLFCIFWSVLLFLSSFRFYNIYEVSDETYFYVLLGSIFFAFGSAAAGYKSKTKKVKNYKLNSKVYKIAVLVCIVSLYLNISFIFEFLKSGFDIHYIYEIMARTVSDDETELSGLYDPRLVILQQFIGYPLLFVIVPISITEYITTKKKSYLFVAIVLSLIRFLYDFRRTYIVIFSVFLIVLLLIRRRESIKNYLSTNIKIKLTKKKKFLIGVIVILLAAVFSFLSSARRGDEGGEDYSLASNFYYYYVGSLPYFSKRLDSITDIQYTYGLTSFRGLFSPIFAGLNILGMDKPNIFEVANDNINSLHSTVEYISKDHMFNSYATCFFEFYLDFGFLGIVLIPFVFGFYAQRLFRNVITSKCNRDVWKYSLFVSLFIYLSVLHFNGVVVCYIWPFIIERLFYKRLYSS